MFAWQNYALRINQTKLSFSSQLTQCPMVNLEVSTVKTLLSGEVQATFQHRQSPQGCHGDRPSFCVCDLDKSVIAILKDVTFLKHIEGWTEWLTLYRQHLRKKKKKQTFSTIKVNVNWLISLNFVPKGLTGYRLTLVQVMAYCHQTASYYLSQCWSKSLMPYGIDIQQ